MDNDLALLLDACHAAPRDWQAKLVAADRAAELGMASTEWWLRAMCSKLYGDPSHLITMSIPTGSRVYGEPTPESDWDWVVPLFDPNHVEMFQAHADRGNLTGSSLYEDDPRREQGQTGYRLSGSFRYGPINMILVTCVPQLNIWGEGTTFLLAEAGLHGPRPRSRAIEVFTGLTRKHI